MTIGALKRGPRACLVSILISLPLGTSCTFNLQQEAQLQQVGQSTGLQAEPAPLENDYPFVLLHGLFGWGREEMLGWLHFGGRTDIQEHLRQQGYYTYTVAVGPISSSWDRAAELYAQLIGGTVDYGWAHSQRHNHRRFGRSYPGVLPDLGKLGSDGRMRKVNVICHSMGTQTIRLLVTLLANGHVAERAACPDGLCPPDADGTSRSISPLFAGFENQFIHAIGSISGANNGSTLANILEHNLEINQLISFFIDLLNLFGADKIYDFKLDQFGIAR